LRRNLVHQFVRVQLLQVIAGHICPDVNKILNTVADGSRQTFFLLLFSALLALVAGVLPEDLRVEQFE
jgi:hypothetical protein